MNCTRNRFCARPLRYVGSPRNCVGALNDCSGTAVKASVTGTECVMRSDRLVWTRAPVPAAQPGYSDASRAADAGTANKAIAAGPDLAPWLGLGSLRSLGPSGQADQLFRRDALRLGLEVHDDAMSEHGHRHRIHIFQIGHGTAVHRCARLGAQDEVL